MSIVINEFEIVAAPPSANAPADPQANTTPNPAPPRPEDIELIEDWRRRRLARVWAD
jgi:hypothetical protein